jgi:SAM-dependent methyltransferase
MSEQPTPAQEDLEAFYEESYARTGRQALLYSRWRALGAVGKADHVLELCARVGLEPASTLDVGCGDGALLCELRARGFGGRLHGVEIARTAVDIAAARPEIDSVQLYDGLRLPAGEHEHELGILSHVLEHVSDPAALLREVARACRAVVVEVPLEDNISGRRAGRRERAEQVGHLRRLSRTSARALARAAGLRVVCELEDPLPLRVHTFFLSGPPPPPAGAPAAATAKWFVRTALHRLVPPLARRLFTVHYACLCVPAD